MKPLWVPTVSFFAGALVMLLGIWLVVGFSDSEHVPVRIYEASLLDEEIGILELLVGSCNGGPRTTSSFGAEYFEVEVTAFRFKNDRDSCQDIVEVYLNQPGEPPPTELLDLHTGEIVEIRAGS